MYSCSKCGLGVVVIPNQPPIKACKCKAPITASLSGTLNGVGGVKI